MTTTELQDLIRDLLDMAVDDHEHATEVTNLTTFENAGVMTRDAGLVVFTDDSEFQVTIVRSK